MTQIVQLFRKDVGFCSETATMPCVPACALSQRHLASLHRLQTSLAIQKGFGTLQYKLILCHWSCPKWWCLWWHSQGHRALFICAHENPVFGGPLASGSGGSTLHIIRVQKQVISTSKKNQFSCL